MVRKVKELIGCGLTEDDTARAVGCSTETLRKHFVEPIRVARAEKRAEAIGLLWKSARGGNVAAQKKLEEMTGRALAEEAFTGDRAPAAAPPAEKTKKLGKKEEAREQANTILHDDDWGADIAASLSGRTLN